MNKTYIKYNIRGYVPYVVYEMRDDISAERWVYQPDFNHPIDETWDTISDKWIEELKEQEVYGNIEIITHEQFEELKFLDRV